uniref:Uncharacterized protein n=1 Tax=Magallana gigas TaxID=29159 RepID=A0A8W8MKU4_MAGGI
MFTISKNNLAKILPEGKFKFVEVMLEVTAKGYFWQEVRAYIKDVLLPYHEKTTLNHQPSRAANRMLKELGGLCQHEKKDILRCLRTLSCWTRPEQPQH